MIDKSITGREKIREQAKKIMDEFVQELKRAESISDFGETRDKNMRERMKKKDEKNFRERMFNNAPKKNDKYLIAEKKKW